MRAVIPPAPVANSAPARPGHRPWLLTSLLALLSIAAAPSAASPPQRPNPLPATPTAAPPTIESGVRCRSARPAPPIVGSTPLVLRAKVHVASQHGCSQSEACQSVIAEISLALSGAQVQLAIESFESSSFGPSAGRYMQGDRNFHRDSTRWRWTYTGVVERAGGNLLLQLNRMETAVDRRGGIDYQEPRHDAAATTVTCTEGTVGLLAPSRWAPHRHRER